MALRTPETVAEHPRRTALLVLLAVVFAAVAVVGVVATLTRDEAPTGRAQAETAAARALQRAGARIAQVEAPAFVEGRFHYVHTRDYAPQQRVGGASDAPASDGTWLVERERELWMDAGGDARMLEVRAAAPGAPAGQAGAAFVNGAAVQLADAGAARVVDDARWVDGVRTDGRAVVWAGDRQVDVSQPVAPSQADNTGTPEALGLDDWAVTADEVASLPTSRGRELTEQVDALITAAAERTPGFVVEGRPEAMQEQLRLEYQVDAAVRMLGNAPLAAPARRAVYEWLAQAPGAELDGTSKDRTGREATAVTFSREFEQQVAGREVPEKVAIAEALEQAPGATVRRTGTNLRVPSHTLQRTWRQTILIDPATGELLETSWLRRETSAPWQFVLLPAADGALEVRAQQVAGAGASEGARVWLSRDSVAGTSPRQSFCKARAAACA